MTGTGLGRPSRFVIVGAGAALMFFALSFLLRKSGAQPFAGTVLAYAITFVTAYSAQHGWTFGGIHSHVEAFPRYLIAQIGCALISGIAGHIAVEGLGLSAFWMSATVTILASAASYLLSLFWVFPTARK